MLFGGALFVVGVPALAVLTWLLVKRGVGVGHALLWAGVGLYVIAAVDRLFFPLIFDPLLKASLAAEAANFSRGNLVPLRTIGELIGRPSLFQAVRQIGGNIGLLLPLGAVLPVLVPRLRRFGALALAALFATLTIEVVQYLATGAGLMDRAFDIDDLILNVLGAAVGYGIWWALSRKAHRLRVIDDYTILPAAPEHIGALSEVERRAGARFDSSVPAQVLSRTIPLPVLQEAQSDGRLWVALVLSGEPVGFALVESSAGRAHLEELDVLPEYGRRGIGAALVSAVEQWAQSRGFRELTLTTYVDFPWNARFYSGIGFEVVHESDLDAEILQRLKDEDALGLERSRRVVMRKLL